MRGSVMMIVALESNKHAGRAVYCRCHRKDSRRHPRLRQSATRADPLHFPSSRRKGRVMQENATTFTVYVIDDDPDFAASLARLLRSAAAVIG